MNIYAAPQDFFVQEPLYRTTAAATEHRALNTHAHTNVDL